MVIFYLIKKRDWAKWWEGDDKDIECVGWGETRFMAEIMRVLGWLNIFWVGFYWRFVNMKAPSMDSSPPKPTGFFFWEAFIYLYYCQFCQTILHGTKLHPAYSSETMCVVRLKLICQYAAHAWSVKQRRSKLHWLSHLILFASVKTMLYIFVFKTTQVASEKPTLEQEENELFNLAWMLLEPPCWVSAR